MPPNYPHKWGLHARKIHIYFARGKPKHPQKMKRTSLLLTALLAAATVYGYKEVLPTDTTAAITFDDVVVTAPSPKGNTDLRQTPAAASRITQQGMQQYRINSIKGISQITPNIFIPDYGSRMTSAVYIRGIGARINTPAVGLYVDNIPYIDKSAFDFSFYDIESIDILRGPQGTLYGRNTMGGLINVHTRSPFTYQGTDILLGAATYHNYNASFTHYHRISRKFAFSAGGFYEYRGGFFKNNAPSVDKNADRLSSGGGRIRAIALPQDNLKLDFTLSYEHNNQGGYAYGLYHPATGAIDPVAYNDESTYRRSLVNGGMNIEYQPGPFVASFITGYQYLDDRMFLDQDFTEKDIFNLMQKQRMHTVSEEIVFKSKPGARWQWATGIFGFYQSLDTEAPVTFKREGINEMIEGNINGVFQAIPFPSMSLQVANDRLRIPGYFNTPAWNAAVYHQSTVNDFLVDGLSVTAGLRLDYERTSMTYNSYNDPMDFDFHIAFAPGNPAMTLKELSAQSVLKGKESHGYLQFLPKFAVQYSFDKRNTLYASVSRGYRSGGYNIQMFSDLIQGELKNAMVDALKDRMAQDFHIPEGQIDQMLGNIPGYGEHPDISESTIYRPEYSWSYEIGAHLSLPGNKLDASLAAFYMDTRDQQVARFSENGFGRMTVNAGRSRSIGAEAEVRAQATPDLLLQTAYGLTHATFRSYASNRKDDTGAVVTTDYSGQFVPFVPRHTLTLSGSYTFRFRPQAAFRHLLLNLCYNGAGKIYWTEQNDMAQDFYGTLNARVSAQAKKVQIDLWGSNLLGQQYAAFYFESLGNRFIQKGKPRQFGIDLRFRF